MTQHYCQTCDKFVTNQWAIIDNMHVGCPKAPKKIDVQYIPTKYTPEFFWFDTIRDGFVQTGDWKRC